MRALVGFRFRSAPGAAPLLRSSSAVGGHWRGKVLAFLAAVVVAIVAAAAAEGANEAAIPCLMLFDLVEDLVCFFPCNRAAKLAGARSRSLVPAFVFRDLDTRAWADLPQVLHEEVCFALLVPLQSEACNVYDKFTTRPRSRSVPPYEKIEKRMDSTLPLLIRTPSFLSQAPKVTTNLSIPGD